MNRSGSAPYHHLVPLSHVYFRFGGNQAERDAKSAAGPSAAPPATGAPGGKAAQGGDKKAATGTVKPSASSSPAAKKEPEGPPDVSRLDIRVRARFLILFLKKDSPYHRYQERHADGLVVRLTSSIPVTHRWDTLRRRGGTRTQSRCTLRRLTSARSSPDR